MGRKKNDQLKGKINNLKFMTGIKDDLYETDRSDSKKKIEDNAAKVGERIKKKNANDEEHKKLLDQLHKEGHKHLKAEKRAEERYKYTY